MKSSLSRLALALLSAACLLSALFVPPAGALLDRGPGTNYLPMLLAAWPTPRPGRLLITEVVYDPNGPEPAAEWIELYNTGGVPLDLSAYKLGDEETIGEQEGMYAFPAGAAVGPEQVILVAGQALAFKALYGLAPDYELRESDPEVPDMVRYTPWAGGSVELGNTGDEVLLLDSRDVTADALSWGSSAFAFDPPAARVPGGHSLERYPADQDSGTAVDWRAAPSSPGMVSLPGPAATPTPQGGTATPLPASALVINELHADPDSRYGDANLDGQVGSGDDEFLEIVNNLDTALALDGWSLQDAVKERHRFPPGSLLPAGCALVVFGGGEPQGSFGGSLVQTASSGGLLLNNEGDTITLLDLTAMTVIAYIYGTEGGDDQSLTRYPDLTGLEPFMKHADLEEAGGKRFSPGTQVDGSPFAGCAHSLSKNSNNQ